MFPAKTKILIVDDMKTMRMVVKKTLKELGFTDVTDADDGDVAWKLLEASIVEQKPFELVVSDWTMARMSGLELLKHVRAHKDFNKLPFLLVTAESDVKQVQEAIAAGVSNYVTKPFTPAIIDTKLKAIWAKNHS